MIESSKLWILLLFRWWITSFRVPLPSWASFIPMVGHCRHLSASLGSSHPCLSGASRVLLALSLRCIQTTSFWPQINLITAFALSFEQLRKNCRGYGISVIPNHCLVFYWAPLTLSSLFTCLISFLLIIASCLPGVKSSKSYILLAIWPSSVFLLL